MFALSRKYADVLAPLLEDAQWLQTNVTYCGTIQEESASTRAWMVERKLNQISRSAEAAALEEPSVPEDGQKLRDLSEGLTRTNGDVGHEETVFRENEPSETKRAALQLLLSDIVNFVAHLLRTRDGCSDILRGFDREDSVWYREHQKDMESRTSATPYPFGVRGEIIRRTEAARVGLRRYGSCFERELYVDRKHELGRMARDPEWGPQEASFLRVKKGTTKRVRGRSEAHLSMAALCDQVVERLNCGEVVSCLFSDFFWYQRQFITGHS